MAGFIISSLIVFLVDFSKLSHAICDPPLRYKNDFDTTQGYGLWYDWEEYVYGIKGIRKCPKVDYTENKNNTVTICIEDDKQPSMARLCYDPAYVVSPGHLYTKLTDFGRRGGQEDYWILCTDYTKYSIDFFCSQLEDGSYQKAIFVYYRNKNETFTKEETKTINECIKLGGFERGSPHKGCSAPAGQVQANSYIIGYEFNKYMKRLACSTSSDRKYILVYYEGSMNFNISEDDNKDIKAILASYGVTRFQGNYTGCSKN